MFLNDMLKLCAPSGCEDEMRSFIIENIKNGNVTIDSIGNIIVHKQGRGKKIMICAHMDEVGIIISGINDDGTLKFKTIGGIDSAVLCGKEFTIGKNHIIGISGIKAVHLQDKDSCDKKVKDSDLYIDIGVNDACEAKKLVSLGDYGTFFGEPVKFGQNLIKSKALDDRVGCSILLEILNETNFDLDLYFVFTSQEEVGTRGAIIASNRINPDIAIVLEGTTCSDVYPTKEHLTVTKLGDGPVFTVSDSSVNTDTQLRKLLCEIATKNNIKYQFKRTTNGGTDAGSIQRNNNGTKVAVISVPCRYLHSPVSVMSYDDYNAVKLLIKALLKEFENGILEKIM